jgi:hypothetical protein
VAVLPEAVGDSVCVCVPEAVVDSLLPEAVGDSVWPEAVGDSVRPAAVVDSLLPEAVGDSVRAEAVVDSLLPAAVGGSVSLSPSWLGGLEVRSMSRSRKLLGAVCGQQLLGTVCVAGGPSTAQDQLPPPKLG